MSTTYLHAAIEAAKAAARVVRFHSGTRMLVDKKRDRADLVSEADRASERCIREVLVGHFPDHVVVGEEGGAQGDDASHRWLVDPIDGTLNYLCGFPYYGINIALEVEGQRTVGVIYDPERDDLYSVERGQGAFLNGAPLRVSQQSELAEAMVLTGFMYRADPDERRWCMERVADVVAAVRAVRRPGTAGLDLAQVASGRFDGFWEPWLKPWDVATGILLIEEAGGVVTNDAGEAYSYDDTVIVASNGRLHDALLKVLAQRPR